jgi:hypothetical protein
MGTMALQENGPGGVHHRLKKLQLFNGALISACRHGFRCEVGLHV